MDWPSGAPVARESVPQPGKGGGKEGSLNHAATIAEVEANGSRFTWKDDRVMWICARTRVRQGSCHHF